MGKTNLISIWANIFLLWVQQSINGFQKERQNHAKDWVVNSESINLLSKVVFPATFVDGVFEIAVDDNHKNSEYEQGAPEEVNDVTASGAVVRLQIPTN